MPMQGALGETLDWGIIYPIQLPVLQVLKGTDDWVFYIFVISSFPTFSRNPFLEVSLSYHV